MYRSIWSGQYKTELKKSWKRNKCLLMHLNLTLLRQCLRNASSRSFFLSLGYWYLWQACAIFSVVAGNPSSVKPNILSSVNWRFKSWHRLRCYKHCWSLLFVISWEHQLFGVFADKPSLSELEGKLLSGGKSRSEAIAIMKDVVADIEKCKSPLSELKMEVEDFQEKYDVTKTVGTTVKPAATLNRISSCKR